MNDSSSSEYDLFARLYDLEHRHFTEDIDFYRNFALRCDGPVLELGCGAGRVSLALARAGFDVVGVDNSAAMLALASAHAAKAGLSDQTRMEQIDVRAPDFARRPGFADRFALAIFPLNGFLHLLTVADQLSALRNAWRALMAGGFTIVDLPNPHVAFTPALDGQLLHRRTFRSPEGHTISSWSSAQTDLAAQVQHMTLLYDEVLADRTVHRTTVELELRFPYRYEMTALLRQAGFQVDAVYGSYGLGPYQADSRIMLFVAYKPADQGQEAGFLIA